MQANNEWVTLVYIPTNCVLLSKCGLAMWLPNNSLYASVTHMSDTQMTVFDLIE